MIDGTPAELVRTFADAARAFAAERDVDRTVKLIEELAVKVLGGCEYAEVCLGRQPTVTAPEEVGMAHVASFPLFVDDRTLGAVNLYSDRENAFDDDDPESQGLAFASLAAVAVATAQQERHLRTALESRDIIGQAKGMLMARQGITSDEAFEVLRRASNRLNQKVRDVAHAIASGELPTDEPPAP